MTRPYSLDLRERVVAAVEIEGLSRHRAAARFGVAVSTAVHWVRRFRTTGNVSPSKIGGYKKKVLRGEHAAWLIAGVAAATSPSASWWRSCWRFAGSRSTVTRSGSSFTPRGSASKTYGPPRPQGDLLIVATD
jgi:transposase-like protein